MNKLYLIISLLVLNLSLKAQIDNINIEDSTKNAIEINFLNEQSFYYNHQITNQLFGKIGADFSSAFSKSEYNSSIDSRSEFGVRLNTQIFIGFIENDFTKIAYGLGPSLFYSNKRITRTKRDYKKTYTTFEYGLLNTLLLEVHFSKKIYLVARYDYLIAKGAEYTERKELWNSGYKVDSWTKGYLNAELSKIKIGVGVRF